MLARTLLVIGLVLVVGGTYYLSKAIFLTAVASRYWLRSREGISLKWRLSGLLFGINENNWTLVFTSDDQLTESQIRRVRDPFAPIRGLLLVVLGTVLQISGTFLA